MLQSNLKHIHIHHFIKTTCTYWKEIWHFWFYYNYKPYNKLTTSGEINNQNIWFNSSILIDNKQVYYYDWYKKGVLTLKDLRQNNKWININELYNKYKIHTNFLTLMALLQAIPLEWRRVYQGTIESTSVYTHEIDKLMGASRPLKYLQGELQSRKNNVPRDKLTTWNIELQDDINEKVWLGNFKKIYKTTIL